MKHALRWHGQLFRRAGREKLPATHTLCRFDRSGRVAALIDMGLGFPGQGDAYLGPMQLAKDKRGTGLGRLALREVERIARAGGAVRPYPVALEAR